MKALVAAIALLAPISATAQQNCADHATVMERLATGYGETRQAIALSAGDVVEIYAALDTGTWTITVTAPGGPTCLVASGGGYEPLVEALPTPGEDM